MRTVFHMSVTRNVDFEMSRIKNSPVSLFSKTERLDMYKKIKYLFYAT